MESSAVASGATAAPAPKRASNGRGAAAKKPRQAAAAKTKKAPASNSAKKKTYAQEFPTSRPKKVPKEIDRATTWRWFQQWQVWQGRLKDTGVKTLFCGLCGFVCPGEKKIKKHFLAEHGDKKFYSCLHCDKQFCLLCNVVEHMEVVHGSIKNAFHFEWGPKKQQTELHEFMRDYERRWNGEDTDSSDDELKDGESDHEYNEPRGAGAESDPDSEGAHEGAEDD
jgi:hypothetical protein